MSGESNFTRMKEGYFSANIFSPLPSLRKVEEGNYCPKNSAIFIFINFIDICARIFTKCKLSQTAVLLH